MATARRRTASTAAVVALALAAAGWFLAGSGGPHAARAQQGDEFEGLPAGAGREEVYYACGACHSLRLVQQQGLSRERWDRLLAWMVEKQGMAEPREAERSLILDYLAEHFGPDRRAAGAPGGGIGAPPLTPMPRAGGGL